MKRRIYALLLVLVMAFPMFVVTPAASEAVVIAWNEPAIPADVGEVIDLSAYAVQYSEGAEADADISWELDGETVTSFTPSEAGVTALTATSDSGTKTVYVVAKEPSETEYVIYFNDFDNDNALDGFVKSAASSRFKIENSNLIIDGTNSDLVRITLPAWLGEFGNYSITARVTSTNEKNTSRWNSVLYRAKGTSYPFYHMCVRKNCGTGSGVEFAMMTPSYAWDVIDSGTHTTNQVTGTYYTYNIKVKDNVILHSIDNNPINYNDAEKTYKIGSIGLIANQSIMHVDYIKVALQLDTPRIEVPETIVVPAAGVENITNAFANVAYPTNYDELYDIYDAQSVILLTDGAGVYTAYNDYICAIDEVFDFLGKNIIPIFECPNKAAVDGVVNLVSRMDYIDASIMSSDSAVIAYARMKQPLLRGIIDLRGMFEGPLSAEDIKQARLKINGNGIKIGLFDAECLDQASAEELRSMLVTVWAYSDADDDAALMHAILTGAHGVVTPSPDKVKAAYSLFASDALTRTPVIIGHRGNPTNAPENSLSSYKLAYENGADIIETDVYISKDGEVVVMHDADISRTTTGTGNIESLTLEQLKSYNLWGENDKFKTQFLDEKIPTLREIFELMQECEGLKLFIEIKTGKTEVCSKIVALAQEYGMMERISVISFTLSQLVNMHNVAPVISCGYLMSAPKSAPSDEIAANVLSELFTSVVSKNTTYNPSYNTLTDKLLNAANARGITIWPWTYTASTGDKFAYAFKAGFNGLTTNDAQYTKNNIKYLYAETEQTIPMGGKRELEVYSITYLKNRTNISDNVNITVISGDDVVSAEGSKLTGLKEGVAYVMCSYSTNLPVGAAKGSYTLYTDVIRVEVKGEDLAAGKSYTVYNNNPRNDSWADTNEDKLTDGVYGKDANSAFVGMRAAVPEDEEAEAEIDVVVDLGSVIRFDRIVTDAFYGAWGVTRPAGVRFAVSKDGVNYSEPIEVLSEDAADFDRSAGDWIGLLFTAEGDFAARYVKVTYHIENDGQSNHIWTSEIEVYGSGEEVAETCALGDFDGDGNVTSDDAVYLLRNTLFPDNYPLTGFADFDHDGNVTSDDAIYLLRHTLFGAQYPIGE